MFKFVFYAVGGVILLTILFYSLYTDFYG